MKNKNRITLIFSCFIFAFILMIAKADNCYAMDKTTTGSYMLGDTSATVELGVDGCSYWIEGKTSDTCDFIADVEYVCSDGTTIRRFLSDQRTYCYFYDVADLEIISIRVDITITANDDTQVTDRLVLY